MYMLRVDKIDFDLVEEVKPSFDNLPETDHKDGKYRLRRYSAIELRHALHVKKFKVLPGSDFTQSSEYNKFQGDVKRNFKNIEEETLASKGVEEIVYMFRYVNELSPGTRVDIHQMRVITRYRLVSTPVSPEGAHQDGYDCIAMVGIDRHNISGGELLISYTKDGEPFTSIPLDLGVIAFLDDKALWHNASPLRAIDGNEKGYMDAFVLTANK